MSTRRSAFGSKDAAKPFAPATKPISGTVMPQTARAPQPQVPAAVQQPASAFRGSALSRPNRPIVPGAKAVLLPVTDDDIEKLGSDLPNRISTTVNTITAKVSAAKFADLGELLVELTANTDKLDPNNYGKAKGMLGWFKNAVTDVRKLMIKNLQSAAASFEALEGKMVEQIQIHNQWKRDLESMYAENEQNYYAVCQDIAKAEAWVAEIRRVIESQPEIDPQSDTAMMQANMIRKAEATLNRASRKADTFRRSRVLIENIAPKILAQQAASDATIGTYQDLMTQIIPIVKMEFALYLQALEVKKDHVFQESVKDISQKAITSSADQAADSIVSAATTANTALISNEALNHTRSAILGAVTQVRQIELQAQQQRAADAQMMLDSQSEYLKGLQHQGAV